MIFRGHLPCRAAPPVCIGFWSEMYRKIQKKTYWLKKWDNFVPNDFSWHIWSIWYRIYSHSCTGWDKMLKLNGQKWPKFANFHDFSYFGLYWLLLFLHTWRFHLPMAFTIVQHRLLVSKIINNDKVYPFLEPISWHIRFFCVFLYISLQNPIQNRRSCPARKMTSKNPEKSQCI